MTSAEQAGSGGCGGDENGWGLVVTWAGGGGGGGVRASPGFCLGVPGWMVLQPEMGTRTRAGLGTSGAVRRSILDPVVSGFQMFFRSKAISSKRISGTPLAVQWLRLRASGAGGAGLIPDWGAAIPHATLHGQKNNNNNQNSF